MAVTYASMLEHGLTAANLLAIVTSNVNFGLLMGVVLELNQA